MIGEGIKRENPHLHLSQVRFRYTRIRVVLPEENNLLHERLLGKQIAAVWK
jgi:hypothetical protein